MNPRNILDQPITNFPSETWLREMANQEHEHDPPESPALHAPRTSTTEVGGLSALATLEVLAPTKAPAIAAGNASALPRVHRSECNAEVVTP